MGMWNKRNEWLVREHECCHEWMHCERVHVTDVLTGADGLSASTNVVLNSLGGLSEDRSVVRNGWSVREHCQKSINCHRTKLLGIAGLCEDTMTGDWVSNSTTVGVQEIR